MFIELTRHDGARFPVEASKVVALVPHSSQIGLTDIYFDKHTFVACESVGEIKVLLMKAGIEFLPFHNPQDYPTP